MRPVMPLGDFLVAYLRKIGALIRPDDLSPVSRKYIAASARRGRTRRVP